MERETYDVIVIGNGPAGMTAAMYCARAGLATVALERMGPGGQMLSTEMIENYPGFPEAISGMDLGEKMAEQARRWGAELAYADVKGFSERDAEGWVTITTDSGAVKCRALIIATGATPAKLGVKGEEEYLGRGVSYCAVCDGNFYRGQTVCVIGGGDSAVEEAVYLSNLCEKVHIIHRRDELRARKVAQESAKARPNIVFELSCGVEEVVGEQFVSAVRVKDLKSGALRDIPCTGVFFYVGYAPQTSFVGDRIDMTPKGFITVNERLETSMEGVFAAGDVRR